MLFNNIFLESKERESVEAEELFGGRDAKVITYGRLTQDSYDSFTPELDGLIETHGKIRLILETIHFEGWTMEAAWEELKLSCKHFNHIERIAIVGDRKREKTMSTMLKPITGTQVRYFDITDIEGATNWISENLQLT